MNLSGCEELNYVLFFEIWLLKIVSPYHCSVLDDM